MSNSTIIDQVAKLKNFRRAGAKRVVELISAEFEAVLKASKNEYFYVIGFLGTFSFTKRKACMVFSRRTGEVIRLKA